MSGGLSFLISMRRRQGQDAMKEASAHGFIDASKVGKPPAIEGKPVSIMGRTFVLKDIVAPKRD